MPKTPGLRERMRAELTEEIKAAARRHLATDGANLSLRAVARELGMVSSALYRYFPSRDDLLTALIIDGYNELGDAVERAEAAVPREDHAGRLLAVAHAVRDWAVADPAEYALLYGSPVPGYQAPDDTIGPAQRAVNALVRIVVDAVAAGVLAPSSGDPLPPSVAADLGRVVAGLGVPDLPPDVLARGIAVWTLLFGLVSFELFGQYNNVITDRRAHFDHQLKVATAQLGL